MDSSTVSTLVVGLMLAALVGFIVSRMVINARAGRSSCGSSCASCASSTGCPAATAGPGGIAARGSKPSAMTANASPGRVSLPTPGLMRTKARRVE
jgi:hypothetical protein